MALEKNWKGMSKKERQASGYTRDQYKKMRQKAKGRSQRQNKRMDERKIHDSGDIKYDSRAAGQGHFDNQDVKNLERMGYSAEQIKQHAAGISRKNMSTRTAIKMGKHDDINFNDLENYDPSAVGRRNKFDLGKAEVREMVKSGRSAKEVNDWAKQNNYSLGGKAQSFLNKRLSAMTEQPPTDVTDPGDGTPIVNTDPEVTTPEVTTPETETTPENPTPPTETFEPVEGVTSPTPSRNNGIFNTGDGNINNQGTNNGTQAIVDGDNNGIIGEGNTQVQGDVSQSIGKTQGDQDLDFTNNGTFIGNNNQGADFSVTIGSNGVGGSGGSASAGAAGLDNMMAATAYGALNENAYHKSSAQLNGTTGAAQAVALGKQLTGAQERIAGLDYAARLNPMFWDAKSKQQTNLYMGDIWKYKAPDFNLPDPLKPVEADLDTDDFDI